MKTFTWEDFITFIDTTLSLYLYKQKPTSPYYTIFDRIDVAEDKSYLRLRSNHGPISWVTLYKSDNATINYITGGKFVLKHQTLVGGFVDDKWKSTGTALEDNTIQILAVEEFLKDG